MCHMTSAADVMLRTVLGAAILIAGVDGSVAQTASQQKIEKVSGIGGGFFRFARLHDPDGNPIELWSQSALSAGLDQGRLCCPLIAKQPHGTAACDGADLSVARSQRRKSLCTSARLVVVIPWLRPDTTHQPNIFCRCDRGFTHRPEWPGQRFMCVGARDHVRGWQGVAMHANQNVFRCWTRHVSLLPAEQYPPKVGSVRGRLTQLACSRPDLVQLADRCI